MLALYATATCWGMSEEESPTTTAPFVIAPQAPDSRNQTWVDVAWASKSRIWLVAWREGYLNEPRTEIHCARVSAKGQPLDPASILVSVGPGLKDHPHLASDGRDFMIVWEDMRGGTDWDVYAARVTSAGKVLDRNGIAVTAAAHNQAHPTIAFAGGSYTIAWMEFHPMSGYGVFATQYGLGDQPLNKTRQIAGFDSTFEQQVIDPTISSNNQDLVLMAAAVISSRYARGYLSVRRLDLNGAKLLGAPLHETSPRASHNDMAGRRQIPVPALVLGPESALVVGRLQENGRPLGWLGAARYTFEGKRAGGVVGLGTSLRKHNALPFAPRPTVAFDGERFLVASDWPLIAGPRHLPDLRIEIHGWEISLDGEVPTTQAPEGFIITGDKDHDMLLPAAAGGPRGRTLVTYSLVLAPDDVKVMGTIVGR
jgi:hypothetical protein